MNGVLQTRSEIGSVKPNNAIKKCIDGKLIKYFNRHFINVFILLLFRLGDLLLERISGGNAIHMLSLVDLRFKIIIIWLAIKLKSLSR
jgi:hypothetical protein